MRPCLARDEVGDQADTLAVDVETVAVDAMLKEGNATQRGSRSGRWSAGRALRVVVAGRQRAKGVVKGGRRDEARWRTLDLGMGGDGRRGNERLFCVGHAVLREWQPGGGRRGGCWAVRCSLDSLLDSKRRLVYGTCSESRWDTTVRDSSWRVEFRK